MESETQIAWAAGLFEGEGHFTIRVRGASWRSYLELGLTTTDGDVMERFSQILGIHHRRKRVRREKPHHKDQWICTVSGKRALEIAETLRPYLGVRRTQRLDEIVAAVAASQPKTRPCQCCGKSFLPSHFRTLQRCCSEPCRDRSKYLRRKYGIVSESEARSRGLLRTTRPEIREVCPHGHAYAGGNLHVYVRPDGRKERRCRTCGRDRNRAFRHKATMDNSR